MPTGARRPDGWLEQLRRAPPRVLEMTTSVGPGAPDLPLKNISGTHVSSERTGPSELESEAKSSRLWEALLRVDHTASQTRLGQRGLQLLGGQAWTDTCQQFTRPEALRVVAPVHEADQALVCLSLPWGRSSWPVGEAVSKSRAARFSGQKKGVCANSFHRGCVFMGWGLVGSD